MLKFLRRLLGASRSTTKREHDFLQPADLIPYPPESELSLLLVKGGYAAPEWPLGLTLMRVVHLLAEASSKNCGVTFSALVRYLEHHGYNAELIALTIIHFHSNELIMLFAINGKTAVFHTAKLQEEMQ